MSSSAPGRNRNSIIPVVVKPGLRFLLCVGLLSLTAILSSCSSESSTAETEHETVDARLAFQREVEMYYNNLAECYSRLGVPAEITEDGFGIRVGEDGLDVDDELRICDETVGDHPDMPPPPSEEELSELYDLMIDAVGCLQREGLPYVDPPSRDVFVESYLASYHGVGAPWWPYTETIGQDECPPPLLNDVIFD